MSGSRKPIELFCSYAHEDEPLLQKLQMHLSILKRQGLISIWYDRQITTGADWTQAIDMHLNSASVILMLISPEFFASDYCYGIEMKRALERHKINEARVIPILLRPVDWQGVPFAHLQALPTNAKPITTWSNWDEALADVATGIRWAIEDLTSSSGNSTTHATLPPAENIPSPSHFTINFTSPTSVVTIGEHNQVTSHSSKAPTYPSPPEQNSSPKRVWNVPYAHNPFFTGREDLLLRLQKQLQTGQPRVFSQPQAISGLGGIGKTQVAVEYAYRHRQDHQAVLWARAESRETLISSFVEIAVLLNLPQKDAKDQTIIVQAVKDWLRTNREWLLILDNADDLAVVRSFLPSPIEGHLLLTTRAQALRGLAQRIEVDTLTPELGALFLLRRASLIAPDVPLEQATPQDHEVAMQISQELGGLPLALDQAGAYIEETLCSLLDYQDLYHTRRAEVLKERGDLERGDLVNDHPEPVATTWSLSFQQVNPSAAELLRFCAFLSPDAIPEEIITAGADHLGPLLQMAARDPMALNTTIAALGAYSLIRRDTTGKTLSIHRLVQAVLIDAMLAGTRSQWRERVVRAVNEVFPEVEFKEWARCGRLLPHALICAKWIDHEPILTPEASHLLHKAGTYLLERAQYSEAEPLLVGALAIREQHLGAEHPDTAQSLNNLADLYRHQGKYEQAEPLYQRALAIREQHLGAEHPDTALSLNNLAILYRRQRKYMQAESLYQRALAIREQHLGAEHPDTAKSLNNLADLYRHQGMYEQAEPLYQRALAIKEQQLGAEHPSTAMGLSNLAELYRQQGKYEQAEPFYHQALAIREQHLGDHPSTAYSLHGLALLYQHQGKYEQAEALYQRVLTIREHLLGRTHPETQDTRKDYAAFLRIVGRDVEATMLDTSHEPPPEGMI